MVSREAFIKTIIERPDEDGPRLVYADWLEEEGESDLASLIRVQCELALHPGMNCGVMYCSERDAGGLCDSCRQFKNLQRRAAALIAAHGRTWGKDVESVLPKCGRCDGDGVWRKGRPLADRQAVSSKCQSCGGTGLAPGVSYQWVRGFPDAFAGLTLGQWCGPCWRCQVDPSRGMDCAICGGVTDAIGPRLALLSPLTSVTLAGVEPFDAHGEYHWYDIADVDVYSNHPPSDLPSEIFAMLPGEKDREDECKRFPDLATATAVLAVAAIRWARLAAGLTA